MAHDHFGAVHPLGVGLDGLLRWSCSSRYRRREPPFPADRSRPCAHEASSSAGSGPRGSESGCHTQLLDEAERSGALVISMDNFVDYRNEYPWLQGNTDGFLGWTVGDNGDVRLERRDLGICSSFSISRGLRSGQLKARHLFGRQGRGTLDREYRCASSKPCLQRSFGPDRLLVLPVLDDEGLATCPGSLEPLEDIGPRRPSVEVKVRPLPNGTTIRVRLVDGDRIVLGHRRPGWSI